jgi:hypothetical protein
VRGIDRAGVYRSADEVNKACGYSHFGEEKKFHNKRKAEEWVDEAAQRPSKRACRDELTRIVCDGVAGESRAAIGLYFGPDDPRNMGLRIEDWYSSWDNRFVYDRARTEACALYLAVKNAPKQGKVIIETPSRMLLSRLRDAKPYHKNNYVIDEVIFSLHAMLYGSTGSRHITVVFAPRHKSPRVQKATDIAIATLEREAFLYDLPSLPYEEDKVTAVRNIINYREERLLF